MPSDLPQLPRISARGCVGDEAGAQELTRAEAVYDEMILLASDTSILAQQSSTALEGTKGEAREDKEPQPSVSGRLRDIVGPATIL